SRDWSSDVCSSDLDEALSLRQRRLLADRRRAGGAKRGLLLQRLADRVEAAHLDSVRGNDERRFDGLEARTCNARPGDDDCISAVGVIGGAERGLPRVRGAGGLREESSAQKKALLGHVKLRAAGGRVGGGRHLSRNGQQAVNHSGTVARPMLRRIIN